MRVVILGAGTGIPWRDHSPAGILVEAGGEYLVFDAGAGTLQRLRRVGVTYLDINRVFLTHFHPDHCLDLVSFLFAMQIPFPPRTKPLVIYGPPGLKRLYRRLNAAFQGWLTPRAYALTLKELGERSLQLGRCTVSTRWMRHSTKALGYRLECDGRRFAYSGDTDVCEAIVELGRDTHLLALECSMPEARKVDGHLTPTACGRIAAAANCRHLLLTHFYPVFRGVNLRARVRRAFRGRLTLARDFTTLHL